MFQIDLTELSAPEYHLVLSTSASAWIEVKDSTNGKVYPRQRLTAVPFAMKVPVDGKTVKYDVNGKLMSGPGSLPAANQYMTFNGSGDYVWGNPVPDGGSNGQFLQTDGSGVLTWGSPAGSGDMNKSTYDVGSNNIVDNSDALGGNTPAFYQDAANLNAGTVNIARIPVGTSVATVAAGNDSRFTDSISTAGRVAGGAIVAGTIAGSTNINTTGFLKTTAYVGVFNQAPVKFYNSDNANYVSLKGPASSPTYVLTLPATAPNSGQRLESNNVGDLSWVTPTPTVIGGTLGANAAFVYDGTNTRVGLGNNNPAAQLDLVTVSDQPSLNIREFAGQTQDVFRIDNAGTPTFIIKPGGDIATNRDGASSLLELKTTDAGNGASMLLMKRAKGSVAVPSPVAAGDKIGELAFAALATDTTSTVGAGIAAFTTEAWTASSKGATVSISATAMGSATPVEVVKIDGNGMKLNGAFYGKYIDPPATFAVGPNDYIMLLTGTSHAVTLPACTDPNDYGRILKFLRSTAGTTTFSSTVLGNDNAPDAVGDIRTFYCTSAGWFVE